MDGINIVTLSAATSVPRTFKEHRAPAQLLADDVIRTLVSL